jgi:hypothetical protein
LRARDPPTLSRGPRDAGPDPDRHGGGIGLRIDHVVLAVRDLDASGDRLLRDHGLASVRGGHHPAWGTANRIVPLGNSYVELLSVVDHAAGASTHLGRTLIDLSAAGDRWFSACLADDDLEATAARLGLEVVPGSRTRPDGTVVSWRSAGIEAPSRPRWLPFFITWDVPPDLHPGRTHVEQAVAVDGIERVELTGDPARMRAWVGEADVPLEVRPGEPASLDTVVVRSAEGDIAIG